jgi:hypothetical protein
MLLCHALVMSDVLYVTPTALAELKPNANVLRTHALGELGVLAAASEGSLNEMGLTESAVREYLSKSDDPATVDLGMQVWEASRSGAVSWLGVLQEETASLPQVWREVLHATWSCTHTILGSEQLLAGPAALRTASLLDATGCTDMAEVFQLTWYEISEFFASHQPTRIDDRLLMGSSLVGGLVLGAVGGIGGASLAYKGGAWLGEQTHKVNAGVQDLAFRYWLASGLAEDRPDLARRIAKRFREEADSVAVDTPDRASGGAASKLLILAHNLLLEDMGGAPESLALMPTVLDLRLQEALEILELVKRRDIETFDAGRPKDQERLPMIRTKWRVVGQYPKPGDPTSESTTIRLAFVKTSERPLPARLSDDMARSR